MNYLTMLEIADMLTDILDHEDVTANSIDDTHDKTIGVYQRADFTPRECIGTDSSYETARIRLFLRWGNDPVEAEQKASEIGGLVQALRDMPTAEHIIKFTDLKAVRFLGKDEKGICEYAIDADLIYSERDEE